MARREDGITVQDHLNKQPARKRLTHSGGPPSSPSGTPRAPAMARHAATTRRESSWYGRQELVDVRLRTEASLCHGRRPDRFAKAQECRESSGGPDHASGWNRRDSYFNGVSKSMEDQIVSRPPSWLCASRSAPNLVWRGSSRSGSRWPGGFCVSVSVPAPSCSATRPEPESEEVVAYKELAIGGD